jgi:hypothetical protein
MPARGSGDGEIEAAAVNLDRARHLRHSLPPPLIYLPRSPR